MERVVDHARDERTLGLVVALRSDEHMKKKKRKAGLKRFLDQKVHRLRGYFRRMDSDLRMNRFHGVRVLRIGGGGALLATSPQWPPSLFVGFHYGLNG